MKKILFVCLLALSAGVHAQTAAPAGPTITGGVEMNIESAQNLNAAVGNESSASQSVGAIESGTIKGDVELGISAEENLNAAVGNKSCADQQIGTIGKASSCK